MKFILNFFKSIFPGQTMLIQQESVAEAVKVAPLPLDIYGDLPRVGEDHDKIIQMIARVWPEGELYPNVRHNRRALYQSICYLRNFRKGGWVYDLKAGKQTVEPNVLDRVAQTPLFTPQMV